MLRNKTIPAPKIIIFSGAGLDAPSGIATFRDSGTGLWNNFDVQKVCNFNTLEENFDEVHEFYDARRTELESKEPNCAHVKIANFWKKYPSDVINVTTNVTDFFERLGVPTIHLHGELTKMKCLDCSHIWDVDYKGSDKCPHCKSDYIKPSVIFFNEAAPEYAKLYKIAEHLDNPDTIIVVIGTSGEVISVDDFIRHKPCKKILCNKHSSKSVREHLYTEVFKGDITDHIDSIIETIEKFKP